VRLPGIRLSLLSNGTVFIIYDGEVVFQIWLR